MHEPSCSFLDCSTTENWKLPGSALSSILTLPLYERMILQKWTFTKFVGETSDSINKQEANLLLHETGSIYRRIGKNGYWIKELISV